MLGLIFRPMFLCFSLLLDFGRIGFVIMTIFLLMHLHYYFVNKVCIAVISCVFAIVYAMLRYLW